jgi:hypothetical protein
MDYPKECKLHERNFTLLQIGDKRLQYVQSTSFFLIQIPGLDSCKTKHLSHPAFA